MDSELNYKRDDKWEQLKANLESDREISSLKEHVKELIKIYCAAQSDLSQKDINPPWVAMQGDEYDEKDIEAYEDVYFENVRKHLADQAKRVLCLNLF